MPEHLEIAEKHRKSDESPLELRPLTATLQTRTRYWITMVCALFSTLWAGLGFLIAERFAPRSGQFSRWGTRWGKALFAPAGLRVVAEVTEDLYKLQPCVFVANHQNSLDIPAMLIAIPVEFGFVAKASLARIPVLGHAISASPSVFVDRSDPRRSLDSMRTAARRIREGSSVLVFAEGERSYGPAVGLFKRSAFSLAAEAGVPVVPVTIHNAWTLFDERRRVARPGTIRVTAGDAFSIPGTSRLEVQQAADHARDVIVSRMKED
jgi:1-acyl-sn-glycerol-3-phosphate acyltransferase